MTIEKYDQGRHHLDVHPIGLALGLTTGIVYAICSLLVALWPTGTLRLFNTWFHAIDLSRIAAVQMTFGSFIVGIVSIVVGAYLVGVLFAWIYNKCMIHCERHGWIQ